MVARFQKKAGAHFASSPAQGEPCSLYSMNFFSLNSSPHPLLHPAISCCYKTVSKHPMLKPVAAIPARDRVIDFGKYRGKMLGTLPSTYLKWVSKNLRARDFEEWARLADEVLEDPVYRDRIEWESAQKLLNGDAMSNSLSSSRIQQSAVSELLDISEKFGWDNEDKLGWAKIDFGLLGTSTGGRIPRLSPSRPRPDKDVTGNAKPKLGESQNRGVEREIVGDDRRRERRERLKMKRRSSLDSVKGSFGTLSNNKEEENEGSDEDIVKFTSPFPGREALIKRALNRRR